MSAPAAASLASEQTSTRAIATAAGGGKARRVEERLTSPWATAAAIIIAVIWTIPTFGLLVSSFRTPEEIRSNGWWNIFVSPSFTFENYLDVLTVQGASSANLGSYFVNSLVIAIPAALFPIILATMAAYAFAWIKFRGSGALFVLIFALQIVPLQMALIPLLQIFSEVLGISGTFPAVWIAHTIFGLPLCIFLLHNFISEIPGEVIEAARVDGASMIRTFWSVALPAARPAAAMLALFTFIATWTNFFWPFIVLDRQNPTLPVALSLLQSNYFGDYSIVMAGVSLSTIPLLSLFAGAGRHLVSGIMQGAVKG